jgi:hypothetical protein
MVATITGLVLAMFVARKRDASRAQAAAQSNDWKDILVAQAERARSAPRLALLPQVQGAAASDTVKQAAWRDLPLCRSVRVLNVQSTGDGKMRGVWMSENQGSPALVLLGARYGEFVLESVGKDGRSWYAQLRSSSGPCRAEVGSGESTPVALNSPVEAKQQPPDAGAPSSPERDLQLVRKLSGHVKRLQLAPVPNQSSQ